MIVDLTEQFLSYSQQQNKISNEVSWASSNFLKSSHSLLYQLETLQYKVRELNTWLKGSSRYDRNQVNKRNENLKQSIRIEQQAIKRLSVMIPDLKCSKHSTLEEFKKSIISTLEMKLMLLTIKAKQMCMMPTQIKANNQQVQQNRQMYLNKAHFLEQTQQELIEETLKNQYKDIQKSILDISQKYTHTLEAVEFQGILVERIVSHIDDIDNNVEGGVKNLNQIQRNEHKNRSIIIKLFIMLYTLVFVYTVFLS